MIFMIKIWLISGGGTRKEWQSQQLRSSDCNKSLNSSINFKKSSLITWFWIWTKKMIFSKNYHVKLYFWKYFWHACCPKFDSLPTFLISWIGPTIQAKKMFSLLKVPYINTRVLDIGIMCQYRYFNPGLCLTTFSLTLLHWPFPYIVFGNGDRNEGVGSGGGGWCYKILKYLYQL